ncbi:MAG TPA: class I SAM-dependent methyltransferase [Cyclobacteriaceae bacterium]
MRKISEIAKTSLSPQSLSILYSKIIDHYNAKNVVELGTSLGVNTLYLASGKKARVTTFEGSSAIGDIATLTFEFAKATNINLLLGNIENTLPAFIQSTGKIDVAFIDANHRYEPTKRYFDWLAKKTHSQSVIILDDIYFSPEMEKAWNEIKKHNLVYTTIDLYRCGLVFFDPSLNKQHVVLQR